jgi:hypothetical protein
MTPTKLYKYRSASTQSIANLSAAKLWFSSPSRFNDPFDCAYEIAISELSKDDLIAIIQRISRGDITPAVLARYPDDVLRQQVTDGLKGAVAMGISAVKGVSCFSEIPDCLLMWGHYSDGHRGFCMEFDTTKEPLFKIAHPVIYKDTFPTIGVEAFTKIDYSQILQLVLTKSNCWKYEREWRVLHREGETFFSYDRASLTAVYFGAKMPEDERLMIASLLGRTDTKFYQMRRSNSTFELVAEPVTFTPNDYRSANK